MAQNERFPLKHVAVIGGGAGGLTATKRLTEPGSGFTCTTFEQTDNVGGTWVYTEQTGRDQYGLPVHSSMYKSIKTNLPKEIMELSGYHHKRHADKSYIAANDVLQYLNDFADNFELRKYIKFRHHVNYVKPIDGDKWEVQVKDLVNQKTDTYTFDGVIICIGNYSNPVYPNYKGKDICKVPIMHSHDYRTPEAFANKRAVVVGSGPSGLDITHDISTKATTVFLSHHSERVNSLRWPRNVDMKPDIAELTENGVRFQDGSYEEVDLILYCTGYTYHYPFLHESCGIRVINKNVQPLYKHTINIEHPTMAIIGIPRDTVGFYMFDLQVRFFLQIMSGDVTLPSKVEMFAHTEEDVKARLMEGQNPNALHILGQRSEKFLNSITSMMKAEGPVPPVLLKIYFESFARCCEDFTEFRKDKYKIVNEKVFVREPGAAK
uniref:Flavin-containing monooxygenase n=1 Tax=Cacopsylla melanoneura TaxID=428564 RepID=A0A8D8LMA6_9HEMI